MGPFNTDSLPGAVPGLNEIDNGSAAPFNPGNNKIAPAVLGAIISGVAALGATGINYFSNRANNRANDRINRENNEFNERMAIDAFKRNAVYNDPKAEMARLSAAGINPGLYYQNGSSPVLQSTPSSASPIGMQAFNLDPMTASNVALNLAQARNLDADTAESPVRQREIEARIRNYAQQDDQSRAFVKNLEANTDYTNEQILKLCDEREQIVANTELLWQTYDENRKTFDARLTKLKEDGNLQKALAEAAANRNSIWESEKSALVSDFDLNSSHNKAFKQAFDLAINPSELVKMAETIRNNIQASKSQSEFVSRISDTLSQMATDGNMGIVEMLEFSILVSWLNGKDISSSLLSTFAGLIK